MSPQSCSTSYLQPQKRSVEGGVRYPTIAKLFLMFRGHLKFLQFNFFVKKPCKCPIYLTFDKLDMPMGAAIGFIM
jgi:hypothetical protein